MIRVHTRVPVVAPERINAALVRALKRPDKATYVVLHANHPRELTHASARALARGSSMPAFRCCRQSVLLRGVNDDAETLGALMRAFVECRIKPYYLHHADLAPGTAHLRTTIAEGQELMRALARTLFRPVPADLCARYSRRPRQIADRAELCECKRRRRERRRRDHADRRLYRQAARLPAETLIFLKVSGVFRASR